MNYLPFAGYWFYGALNSTERAVYFCSWGLVNTAPGIIVPEIKTKILSFLRWLFAPIISNDYSGMSMVSENILKVG